MAQQVPMVPRVPPENKEPLERKDRQEPLAHKEKLEPQVAAPQVPLGKQALPAHKDQLVPV